MQKIEITKIALLALRAKFSEDSPVIDNASKEKWAGYLVKKGICEVVDAKTFIEQLMSDDISHMCVLSSVGLGPECK